MTVETNEFLWEVVDIELNEGGKTGRWVLLSVLHLNRLENIDAFVNVCTPGALSLRNFLTSFMSAK